MAIINRNTDYAIRAISYIAKVQKDSGTVSTKEVYKNTKISRPFLRKILQILAKNKIVESIKGKGGGFRLKHSPKDIYIIDLIKIFQGKIELSRCLLGRKICPHIKRCKLRKKIDKIEQYVLEELSSITIKDLLEEAK